MAVDLGTFGIWQPASLLDVHRAAEAERLGYGTVWIGGSPPADLGLAEELLDATSTITVATGIVNIWQADPHTVASSYHRIAEKHAGRFLLGVGIGHPEATRQYQKPYDTVVNYLDRLDDEGVPVEDRALAALGPRMLRLAAERTAGAHPYLTTPAHTRRAREIMGPRALVAPEHKVVLDTDVERARTVGRQAIGDSYLQLTNYATNVRRLGYSDADLAAGGSDQLIDALVLHGDTATVARKLGEHVTAGADHVCVQVLGDDRWDGYRSLATALTSD
ncbi:LLM class F420-dependent oxidoreductase [Actinobacteria bacterium YIM 96077]|uniref:LLM class F420-dependent oxidoreductase n=1 Tax=Phytoactinopolyspora halophila TaxID=1981511 RepID=A0A329R3V3_9ACTN|nr:LLM class F420-dependent oxidoreductase [Phytoactinopolyspora halophila]AYY12037.1 LLM class F420-dependent oxidoreductase [Actinobacteria bacterium YIM 96077]RAW18729.1 LLM class F420-dependent oxidoreductase [Phytoactinopolyspora halophila]